MQYMYCALHSACTSTYCVKYCNSYIVYAHLWSKHYGICITVLLYMDSSTSLNCTVWLGSVHPVNCVRNHVAGRWCWKSWSAASAASLCTASLAASPSRASMDTQPAPPAWTGLFDHFSQVLKVASQEKNIKRSLKKTRQTVVFICAG